MRSLIIVISERFVWAFACRVKG